MALGDIWAVKMRFFQTGVGKTFAPGFSLYQSTSVDPTILDVQVACEELWGDIKGIFDPSTTYVATTLRRVKPVTQLEVIATPVAPIAGTAAATDPLPANVAIVVNLRTDFIGKSYRGRTYLPAPAESSADQTLSEANAQLVADSYEAMRVTFEADDTPIAVWSRKEDLATVVTSVRVDQRLRSQRRRQQRPPSYVTGT